MRSYLSRVTLKIHTNSEHLYLETEASVSKHQTKNVLDCRLKRTKKSSLDGRM